MKNKTIPIFYATDDNYVPFLCVSLCSLIKNANKNYNYNIHILNCGLLEENIMLIKDYESENVNIIFTNVSHSMKKFKKKLFLRDYYSNAIYYRLFIPNNFKEYDKVIYLDSDTVVKGDISMLYNNELGTNLLAATSDEAVANVKEFQDYTKNYLGVDGKNYFNSGVLVMNLKLLRKENFEKEFLNLLTSFEFKVAPDQDCLNVLCKDRILYLNKSWNKMPFNDNSVSVDDLNLIHYNLTAKPWHYSNILYEEEFWKYAKLTKSYNLILKLKNDYTKEEMEKDRIGGENLIILAKTLSESDDNFINFAYANKKLASFYRNMDSYSFKPMKKIAKG